MFNLVAVGDNCIDRLGGHANAVLVGGNAVNVAVQVARGGLRAAYAGAVGPRGEPDGDRVAAALAANGVDTRWLVRRATPTSVTEIDVDGTGERTIVKEDFGACAGWAPDDATRTALAQARHVHIGWLDDAGALRRSLAACGTPVSQDISVNATSPENIRPGGLSIVFASLPETRADEAANRAAALVAAGAAAGAGGVTVRWRCYDPIDKGIGGKGQSAERESDAEEWVPPPEEEDEVPCARVGPLASRPMDWDIKRMYAPRLKLLERRTRRAIVAIVGGDDENGDDDDDDMEDAESVGSWEDERDASGDEANGAHA
jgi:fructoselysine 6-kinase